MIRCYSVSTLKPAGSRWGTGVVFQVCCSLMLGLFQFAWSPNARTEAQETFPYSLVVTSETAEVYSGPGKSHYATDRLPRGTKVEIYRHDPGGMMAIRPPRGSFSLILAELVRPTADPKVVEVASSVAKAWVGTRLGGQVSPMWQLKLKKGELLTKVKQVAIADSVTGESVDWLQVEPPAGEFRWIHKDDLGNQAPATVSEAEIAQQQLTKQRSKLLDAANRKLAESGSAVETDRDGWRNVSPNEAIFGSTAQPSVLNVPSDLPYKKKIDWLDLQLTQMVLRKKQSWSLNGLEAATARLRSEAKTGDELAMADRLAGKITGFQKLRLEARATEAGSATSRTARLLPPFGLNPRQNDSRQAANRDPKSSNYSARGVLRKMVVNGGVGPAVYALEDKSGRISQTVSPSTGVNLDRYVDREVGLFGRSGFNRRLNRPHLTAQRVVDLALVR